MVRLLRFTVVFGVSSLLYVGCASSDRSAEVPEYREPTPEEVAGRDCKKVGETGAVAAVARHEVAASLPRREQDDVWRYLGFVVHKPLRELGYSDAEVFELVREVIAAGPFADPVNEMRSAKLYYARRCTLRKQHRSVRRYSTVAQDVERCLYRPEADEAACVDRAIVDAAEGKPLSDHPHHADHVVV